MEGPDCHFLLVPHAEVFDDPIQDEVVLIVPVLEVVLDLVRVVPLPHQAVGGLVDIVVPPTRHLVRDVLDVDLVPVLLLVYKRKGRLDSIELQSFDDGGEVVQSRDEMGIPFHENLLLYALDVGHLGTQQSEQYSSSFVVQLITLTRSHVSDLIEATVQKFEDLVIVNCFYLADDVVESKALELQTVEHVFCEGVLVPSLAVLEIVSFCVFVVHQPFPVGHRILRAGL